MKTRILIVSYSKDIPYLRLNLKTIRKFASGFSGLTIVVPGDERPMFEDLAKGYEADLRVYDRPTDPARWQIAAQCQKCWADGHCPDADYILHTDSDCIFTEPVTPEDYFQNDKPVMLYEAYSRLSPSIPWKVPTEQVLGRPVEFEFMRRHPQVNPLGVYSALRLHVEKLHKRLFTDFVHSRNPNYPWGFSEHNAIGAFAYYDPTWQLRYHWHDVALLGSPREKLMQFWSHAPVDEPQDISHGGRFTPADYTRQILTR